MKEWIAHANALLKETLEPPKHELNELDWKEAVSPDKKRLAEHLSALANYPGGAFLVYGIDRSGALVGISGKEIDQTLSRLSSIGRNGLEPPISLDHAVSKYESVPLLFVHIHESPVKPVHIRGRPLTHAFIRSGGTTRNASRQEIGTLMLNSRTPRWEELRASILLTDSELLSKLDLLPILEMTKRPPPSTKSDMIAWAANEGFVDREPSGGGYITNLGAMSAAVDLGEFDTLSRKAVRIVVYGGKNKALGTREREGKRGYAIAFQNMLKFVTSILPQSEVIEQALRQKRTMYPEIALREIIANALIHQDFTISGAGPMIEIFSDRIEISNPGGLLPSKQLDRLIGTQPESRNERLARAFRLYKICEERGSGLIKAGLQVEFYGLPPMEFNASSNSFKVTLYAPRTFSEMSSQERLDACYQHAVLMYRSDGAMTNVSLRKRLKMPVGQRSMVSVLLQDAIDSGRIKSADPHNRSKKFAKYWPYWA